MADFTMKAHDRLPSIQAMLGFGEGDDFVPVDLTLATGVRFILRPAIDGRPLPGGTPKVKAAGVIVAPASGIVSYDWTAVDTDTPGTYVAEWQVTWTGAKPQTFPTKTYHTVDINADLDGE